MAAHGQLFTCEMVQLCAALCSVSTHASSASRLCSLHHYHHHHQPLVGDDAAEVVEL
jgi:hypothetical protein